MTETESNTLQDELEKLKQANADLTAGLVLRDTRVKEIEQALNAKDGEIGQLQQTVSDLKTQLDTANTSLKQAVVGYRAQVVQANPEIPPELITGETFEAIENAVANAGKLVGKVKEKLAAAQTRTRIPPGAPPRRPPDLSALSPREKIQQGIGGRRG